MKLKRVNALLLLYLLIQCESPLRESSPNDLRTNILYEYGNTIQENLVPGAVEAVTIKNTYIKLKFTFDYLNSTFIEIEKNGELIDTVDNPIAQYIGQKTTVYIFNDSVFVPLPDSLRLKCSHYWNSDGEYGYVSPNGIEAIDTACDVDRKESGYYLNERSSRNSDYFYNNENNDADKKIDYIPSNTRSFRTYYKEHFYIDSFYIQSDKTISYRIRSGNESGYSAWSKKCNISVFQSRDIQAQLKLNIEFEGVVYDSTVKITLLPEDSHAQKIQYTKVGPGDVTLYITNMGDYTLRIKSVGYKEYEKVITVSKDNVIIKRNILLKEI